MTSKLKCPFCGRELEYDGRDILMCVWLDCKPTNDFRGTKEMWEVIRKWIQSLKDLQIARQALEEIAYGTLAYPEVMARETLETIEHKE